MAIYNGLNQELGGDFDFPGEMQVFIKNLAITTLERKFPINLWISLTDDDDNTTYWELIGHKITFDNDYALLTAVPCWVTFENPTN